MSTRYRLVDLVVDLEERSVSREGEPLHLTDLSFGVLAELIKAAPGPVSMENLALAVWLTPHVTVETMAQRIKILRRSLADDATAPRYIKTIRGAGYACARAVQVENDPDPQLKVRVERNALTGIPLAIAIAGVLLIFYLFIWNGGSQTKHIRSTPPSVASVLVERAQTQLEIQQAEETDRAIEMLRQAYALDSSNSIVHVVLSVALSTRVTKFRATDGDIVEAEALARRAILTDAKRGSAWGALAYSLDAQGRVDEALSSYRRAYELDPSDAAAMSSAAYLLSIRGRLFEALILEARAMSGEDYSRYADSQIALTLDLIGHPAAHAWRKRAQLLGPNHIVVLAEVAEAHLRRGQPVAALEVLARAAGSDGESPRLLRLSGRAALARGDISAARREFIAAGHRGESDLAALTALSERPEPAQQLLKKIRGNVVNGDSWPGLRVQIAELHASLGDDEAALDLLSQAVDLGWRDAAALEQSPFLKRIVSTGNWPAIRQRIERELAMQRTLIENSPELASILEEKS